MADDPNAKLYAALEELGRNFVGTSQHPRGIAYLSAVRGMKEWVKKQAREGRAPGRFTDHEADTLAKSPARGGAHKVGKKIAAKIKKWNETFDASTDEGKIGQLELFRAAEDPDEVFARYDYKTATPEEKVIKALTSVPYVGKATAARILERLKAVRPDLVREHSQNLAREHSQKSDKGEADAKVVELLRNIMEGPDAPRDLLSANQAISLRFMNQTSERMPRSFVTLVSSCVAFILEQAYGRQSDHTWTMTVGGSYSRGERDSGDLDLVLYVPSKMFALWEAVRILKRYGFVFEQFSQGTSKFLGLGRCKGRRGAGGTAGDPRVFKVDILYVDDPKERNFALLHYSLGKIPNQNLRQLAKKAGLKLEQTGLYADFGREDKSGNRTRIDLGLDLEGSVPPSLFEERISEAIARAQAS